MRSPKRTSATKTKVPIRNAKLPVLGLQRQLQQRDHIPGHFRSMVTMSSPGPINLATVRVGGLCDSQNASADMLAAATHQKVGIDYGDTFYVDRLESRRLTQCHGTHPERILVALEQTYGFNATQCFVTDFGLDVDGRRSDR